MLPGPLPNLFTQLAVFGRPWSMLWRHRPMVLVGLCCVPVHAAVLLWIPRLFGEALDDLQLHAGDLSAGNGIRDALFGTCMLLVGLAFAESGFRFVARRLLIDASRLVEQELKDRLFAHLQRLPVAWFDRARTGDLVSRMTQDIELVRFVMGPLLLHGGSTLCLLPAGFGLMMQLDVPVTLAVIAAFGVMFLMLRLVLPRLHRWSKASQEAIGALSQRAHEDLAGIRVLQQFAAQDREAAAIATRNRRYLVCNLRQVRLRALLNAVTHTTTGMVTLVVLSIGGHQVIDGQLTVGQLFQFVVYLGLLMMPLEILGWVLAAMPRAIAAMQRVDELFRFEPEEDQGLKPRLTGHLAVRNLTFTYPGSSIPALRDVSFELPAGQKLGLVGSVGCGKSTLLALCLRFYDPPRNTIFLDGHDILDLAPSAVRAVFATAPQEPFLFSDTLRGNVIFGSDEQIEVSTDRVAAAVSAAALDQDLDAFPDGIDTIVGERGVTLSGGQKQRASLARALLSDRPALMLDDTLSAVDPHTERRILDGLRRSRDGRTMVVVSHRISVVRDADLTLVLDDGVVVERGDHEQLLRLGGRYAQAWRRQTEERALEGDSLGGDA